MPFKKLFIMKILFSISAVQWNCGGFFLFLFGCLFLFVLFCFFWLCRMACGILVP